MILCHGEHLSNNIGNAGKGIQAASQQKAVSIFSS